MTNKSTEEILEELEEIISNKYNYDKEIVINDYETSNLVQIALGINREENQIQIQLMIINGTPLKLEPGYFQNPTNLVIYIDLLLSEKGIDLDKSKIVIYKYDYCENMYKLIPEFNNGIDYRKSIRKLIDPTTLEVNKTELILHYIDTMFNDFKDSLSEDFITVCRQSVREGYANFKHLELTIYDKEFLRVCREVANQTKVVSYLCHDRSLGTIAILANVTPTDTICYREEYSTVKCFEIPFKIFGSEVYKDCSLLF